MSHLFLLRIALSSSDIRGIIPALRCLIYPKGQPPEGYVQLAGVFFVFSCLDWRRKRTRTKLPESPDSGRHSDTGILPRLAHGLENIASEFWQFIAQGRRFHCSNSRETGLVLRTSIARAMPTRTSLSKDDNFDSTAVILTA
jgi:hypothetical protein